MKTKALFGAQLLLGVLFVVFGLNGFLNFIPQPPPPEGAMGFLGGLASSGYFFPFLKGTEILVGLALLTGFFAPLALVVLAPITLNILLFHAILAPAGVGLAVLILVLHLAAAYRHKGVYAPLLKAR